MALVHEGGEDMQERMNSDDARAFLQSTQELRTHWSGVITTHLGYAVVVNAAIWSYFLKSYIDSLASGSQAQPSYVVLAAALSALLLGLWRLYTHHVDNHIAGLYPDFLLCEAALSVGPGHGTSGYLMRAVPRVDLILSNEGLTPKQKMEGISTLVKSRRIGRRGHLSMDVLVLVTVLGMLAAGLSLLSELSCYVAIGCIVGISIGLLLVLFGLFLYQRNPSEKFIKQILSKLERKGQRGT